MDFYRIHPWCRQSPRHGASRTFFPSSTLMQLTIEFNLNAPWNASRAPGSSFMDRDSFLNDILNCNEIKDALRQFPALQDISLRLWENDTLRYGEEWWRSEIESRLQPDLRAAISVDLNSKIWISTWSSSVLR